MSPVCRSESRTHIPGLRGLDKSLGRVRTDDAEEEEFAKPLSSKLGIFNMLIEPELMPQL